MLAVVENIHLDLNMNMSEDTNLDSEEYVGVVVDKGQIVEAGIEFKAIK